MLYNKFAIFVYAIQLSTNVNTKSIRDSSTEAPSEDCVHDFCNNATNYDSDKVNQLLFKNQYFLPFFGKVIDLPISSGLKRPTRSLEHQKQNLCSTRTYTMYPRKGRAIDLQDKHIVNIPGYYQMIRYEACIDDHPKFIGDHYLPIGIKGFCETQYIVTRIVIINQNETLDLERFYVPSGCSCMYAEEI